MIKGGNKASPRSFSLDDEHLAVNLTPEFVINQLNIITIASDIAQVVDIRLMRSQTASESVQPSYLVRSSAPSSTLETSRQFSMLSAYSMTSQLSIGDFLLRVYDCAWYRRPTAQNPCLPLGRSINCARKTIVGIGCQPHLLALIDDVPRGQFSSQILVERGNSI